MSQFISTGDQYANPCGLGDGATANGNNASGFKMGSGSKAGVFTSGAVGVTGDKKLGFYAVAWKGKKATIYVKVDNGSVDGESSFAINANETATGNPPFKLTGLNDAELLCCVIERFNCSFDCFDFYVSEFCGRCR